MGGFSMSKKILIIEDSAHSAEMISHILESEGYETAVAKSSAEGFQRVISEGFDLVVIDIVLPDIHGFEVCREIKNKLGAQAPKVIALTGVIDAIDVVGARRAGADDFCVKTQDMSQLLEAVKKLVNDT
jgi:two-component system response regulator ArlR